MTILLNFILPFVGILHMKLTLSDTPTKEYTSYRRYPLCSPSHYMRYPETTEDVVSIVKEAIAIGVKVKAFGSRHSQTDIICTEGIPIDMKKLTSRQLNSDNTATFGSGITLYEAGKFLNANHRALRTTPAYGGITLGGALGTGAHGSSIKYNASISSQVVKMTVVDGRGDVIEITDPVDLKSFKINLGLLGIVVNITLDTVPLYKVHAHTYVTSDEILTNGVAAHWAEITDSMMYLWFPAFNEVVVGNLTFVSAATRGTAKNKMAYPTSDAYNLIATSAKNVAMSLTSSECAAASTLGYTILHVVEYLAESSLWTQTLAAPAFTENGVTIKNPAVGLPHEMLASICSDVPTSIIDESCIWAHGHINANVTLLDNEFNLALSDLNSFIQVVKDILSKTPVAFPLLGVVFRFSDKSSEYMSTSYGRKSVLFEFFLWNRDDPYNDASASLAGYQTILQTLAKQFKARSHWGKSGHVYHSQEMLELKLDPEARSNFIDAMKKFDPDGIFLNNFGRRLLKTGTKTDIDPLTTRCALLDNCFCTSENDCAKGQICTTLPGYSAYPVCATKNVAPPTKFNKSILPPPLGIGNYLISTVPALVTAVLLKCSVSNVVDTVPVPNVVGKVDKVTGGVSTLIG